MPEILKAAKDANVEIILPVDFTVSSKFGEDGEIKDFSFGMGLKYKSFSFDVANVPQAEGLKRPFRFSLTACF